MLEVENFTRIPKNYTGAVKHKELGYVYHYLEGKLHNMEGPAVEYGDGKVAYYVNDVEYTKSRFEKIQIWEDIKTPLNGAKAGDFVEILWNPYTKFFSKEDYEDRFGVVGTLGFSKEESRYTFPAGRIYQNVNNHELWRVTKVLVKEESNNLTASLKQVAEFRQKLVEEFKCALSAIEIDFDPEAGGIFTVNLRDCRVQSYCHEDLENFCKENNLHGIMNYTEGNCYVSMTPNEP